jgi:hypothetical protein
LRIDQKFHYTSFSYSSSAGVSDSIELNSGRNNPVSAAAAIIRVAAAADWIAAAAVSVFVISLTRSFLPIFPQ